MEVCNAVLDIMQPTPDRPMIINLPVTVEMSMPHVYANQIVSDDFNLDGSLDIAVANYIVSGSVSVLPGLGNGRCGQMVSFSAGGATTGLVAADLDRDGKLDVAACNSTSQNITFLRSTAQ